MKSALTGSAKLNWSPGRLIEKWDGITVEDGRVTKVVLAGRNLDGVIPAGFGSLSNLVDITLKENQLSGEIPSELGNLVNLTRLEFFQNNLSGEIPSELGRLTNLTYLDVGSNGSLSGEIPKELGNLSNLEWLDLGRNQLEWRDTIGVGQSHQAENAVS